MKSIFDFLVSLTALVVLSPVLLLIAILVRIKHGSPVLFCQARPGRNGKVFTLFKFRTMTAECDANGRLKPDAERLTRFGQWLRATSLDELPEFWNILLGDMSLVGPRPLLVAYLPRYSREEARRHEVRPGLTGWAQVNGRNATTWEERLRLDLWYVDHHSFWLDAEIIIRTAILIFRREGINAAGSATMPEFRPPASEV